MAAQTADSAYTLDEITITGGDDSTDIVARTAASGTKTDAPLLDTPGSVSVVTAAEIEMRQAKTLMRQGRGTSYDTALEMAASAQALMHSTADHMEGVEALLDKRAPRFTGR